MARDVEGNTDLAYADTPLEVGRHAAAAIAASKIAKTAGVGVNTVRRVLRAPD
jgi:hypothetical protein